MKKYLGDELEDEAREELKRADHLIYITLKYTKTCDVIKNTIQRLINAFDFTFLESLEYAKNKKLIKDIPTTTKQRTDLIKEILKNEQRILGFIDFYYLLKKIDSSEFERRAEYRKGITMVVKDKDLTIEVDIETLKNYFEKTKEFRELIKSWIKGEL